MINRIYCPVCGSVHFPPMCSQKGAVVNPGGVGAPDFDTLNPIKATSNFPDSNFNLPRTGHGKCPNCGIKTEVTNSLVGSAYTGKCSTCGSFQTLKVWGIKF